MNIAESRLRSIIREELGTQEGIIHWDKRKIVREPNPWYHDMNTVRVFIPATLYTPADKNSMSQCSYAEEEQVKAFTAERRIEDGIKYALIEIKWLGKRGVPVTGPTHRIELAYQEKK